MRRLIPGVTNVQNDIRIESASSDTNTNNR